jgi:hypothetical protein
LGKSESERERRDKRKKVKNRERKKKRLEIEAGILSESQQQYWSLRSSSMMTVPVIEVFILNDLYNTVHSGTHPQ